MNSFTLDEEIKELLENYKYKRASVYEPCTTKNINQCLIGLAEEFASLNINFLNDTFADKAERIIDTDTLVSLINAVWNLIQKHKNSLEKCESLTDQNYSLERNNKKLNCLCQQLKEKVSSKENDSRACVSMAQRISDHSDSLLSEMTETRAKLVQLTKQKAASERNSQNEISRLKSENQKLLHKLQNKSGKFTSCSEICGVNSLALKESEKKHKAIIAKLEDNNAELIQEILHLKEELILTGLEDVNLDPTRP